MYVAVNWLLCWQSVCINKLAISKPLSMSDCSRSKLYCNYLETGCLLSGNLSNCLAVISGDPIACHRCVTAEKSDAVTRQPPIFPSHKAVETYLYFSCDWSIIWITADWNTVTGFFHYSGSDWIGVSICFYVVCLYSNNFGKYIGTDLEG